MQQKKLILGIVFLICIGFFNLQAQETISTSGGNAFGTGGTASYTIGQVSYSSNFGTNGSVTEGVQQTFNITTIDGIEQANDINLNFKAYPNPTADFLTLGIKDYDNINLSYQLFDTNGRLIESKKIEGYEATISMTQLVPGVYFLKVIENDKSIKTFQIIKK